jgi:hypothetical protein
LAPSIIGKQRISHTISYFSLPFPPSLVICYKRSSQKEKALKTIWNNLILVCVHCLFSIKSMMKGRICTCFVYCCIPSSWTHIWHH